MLTISTDTFPQTGLSYVAFRIAFRETVERMALAQQVGNYGAECFGYLTEVPFLRGVAPHVQVDLLAETWAKHVDSEPFEANLLDESVVYAVCETSSRLVEEDEATATRLLEGGPLEPEVVVDRYLAAELRALHLNLANDGDFLMVSQFEDMGPEEAREMKQKFGLDPDRLEDLFEVLGRWLVSADFLSHLSGLLTPAEIVRAVKVLAGK